MDDLYREFETMNKEKSIIQSNKTILDEIKKIYFEDSELVNNIIEFYKKLVKKHIHIHINDIIELIRHRMNFFELDENKIKIMEYKDIIFHYFLKHNIFNELYEQYIVNSFIPRVNQKEAFELIDKNIETGIHCQATGCGKSYIILYYIKTIIEKYNRNSNIILFTERIDILNDMFKLKSDINEQIIKWKQMGIVDLSNTKIIDRVIHKDRKWVNEFVDTQACLLLINRSFLTTSHYKELNNIHLVLHDECHNTPSKQCFEFLNYMKKKDVPIIGFSATPVRSNINELEKVKEIYSKNNNINLLTDYNMIYSISENLILPPEFYWYYYDDEVENSILNELLKILPQLFYKKIIIWCQTIKNTQSWKKIFETFIKENRELSDFKLYIDTSKDTNEDYDNFYQSNGQSILFCATKHREGSDIPYLDCCLFADKVKKRGMIPFMQSIGRVLRKAPNKKKGIILEGIIKNNDYYKDITNKIIDYYYSMYNSCTDNETRISKLNELLDKLSFNEENNQIYMNILHNERICINVEKKYMKYIEKNIKTNIRENIKNIKQSIEIDDDYTNSKIEECIINGVDTKKTKFKQIIEYIYKEVINDYDKLKDTPGVKRGDHSGSHGYTKIQLNNGDIISLQGKNSNTIIQEIKSKCEKYNISVTIKLIFKDQSELVTREF